MSFRSCGYALFAIVLTVCRSAAADVEYQGRVVPTATVELRSRVPGHVIRVAVKAGDAVKKGDLLFEIDPRWYEADLEKARHGITQAEARLRYFGLEVTRDKALRQTGGVNQQELDRAESERVAGEATVLIARAALDQAKLNLEFTKVLAPMNGRINNPLAVGSIVRANRYVLATLVADDPIVVAFDVDEKTALRLGKSGGTATVAFADETGFPHQGKIDSIGGEVDPKTGTLRLRLALPSGGRPVLPGMSAKVRVTLP
jgi:RND family efflux transporter MFP subunit